MTRQEIRREFLGKTSELLIALTDKTRETIAAMNEPEAFDQDERDRLAAALVAIQFARQELDSLGANVSKTLELDG